MGHVTPGETATGHVTPGETATGHVTPGETAMGHVTPGETAVGHVTPGETATGHMKQLSPCDKLGKVKFLPLHLELLQIMYAQNSDFSW